MSMRIAGAVAAFLILAGALSAVADEIIPARKAGLWEIRTIRQEVRMEGKNTVTAPRSFRQCTDAATDQMLMKWTGFLCPTRNVKRSGNAITIDEACMVQPGFHVGKSSAASHTTITGDFGSVYTMRGTFTMTGGIMRAGLNATWTQEAKWLGPCTADQKPGDIIWSDGRKYNVLEPPGQRILPWEQPGPPQ
jgi:hypothetical protein